VRLTTQAELCRNTSSVTFPRTTVRRRVQLFTPLPAYRTICNQPAIFVCPSGIGRRDKSKLDLFDLLWICTTNLQRIVQMEFGLYGADLAVLVEPWKQYDQWMVWGGARHWALPAGCSHSWHNTTRAGNRPTTTDRPTDETVNSDSEKNCCGSVWPWSWPGTDCRHVPIRTVRLRLRLSAWDSQTGGLAIVKQHHKHATHWQKGRAAATSKPDIFPVIITAASAVEYRQWATIISWLHGQQWCFTFSYSYSFS